MHQFVAVSLSAVGHVARDAEQFVPQMHGLLLAKHDFEIRLSSTPMNGRLFESFVALFGEREAQTSLDALLRYMAGEGAVDAALAAMRDAYAEFSATQ